MYFGRELSQTHREIISGIIGLIVLLVICTFYIKSFITLHRYTQQVQAQQPNPSQGNFDVVKYRKTLKTMVAILGCLVLCQLPLLCVFMFAKYLSFLNQKIFSHVTIIVLGLNSSLNPVIYLIRFTDIRQACRHMLRNLLCRH